ncbi:hypothetical protein [Ancylomarina euxinus]|nr:hypothetical protein [Ancylomarina euxinus]MCZ4696445.1 hypothetical protein [Ancylomarina euxinus]
MKVNIPYDPHGIENLLLLRYGRIIEEGYSFSEHDFDLFCAILIRKHGIENLSPDLRERILNGDKIKTSVQFQITALAIEQGEEVQDEELESHTKERICKAIERKKIVKKEIARTGVNAQKVTLSNSKYYRTLLNLIKDFVDITLIDWLVPITLTFGRFVHIYVKHVEETKFGEGQFKRRSFFDYKHDELYSLIKKILSQEENSIKDHFLEVSVGLALNKPEMVKDYRRGIGKHPPINMNGDQFKLTIDKTGKIMSFHQIK